jgi:hypothetical protein
MESNSIDQWFYLSFTHVKQKKRIPKAVLLHSHETGQATVKCFLFLLVHCIFFYGCSQFRCSAAVSGLLLQLGAGSSTVPGTSTVGV